VNADSQPPDFGWISHVVFWGWVAIFGSAPVVYLVFTRLLNPRRLAKLPDWLRWVLVIPTALVVGTVAEMVAEMAFRTVEVIENHHLTFKPGVDYLIWQWWEAFVFVVAGVQMAPLHRFRTFLLVGGIKIAVAIVNTLNDARFVASGGSWNALSPIVHSPLWWDSVVHIMSILTVSAFGFVLAKYPPRRLADKRVNHSDRPLASTGAPGAPTA
jgi:hypothetical protein